MVSAMQRPFALLTHSYYEEDPRVRRQAETIARSGREVHVFALRRDGDGPEADLDGVRIHHLDVQRHQGAGLVTYLAEYLDFFVRSTFALARSHARRRYGLVQVATLPDWLVFAALPLRMAGVPVILDLHEAMPEFFRSRFPGASNPIVHRVLRFAERASIAGATHAITVNDALRDRLLAAGVAPGHVSVVPNTPSLARFDPRSAARRAFMEDGVLRIAYAGALTPTYELDVSVRAVARLREARPDLPVRLDLYGRGDSEPGLRELATELGVAEAVAFHGRIPIEDVAGAIAGADLGLAPTRRDAFTDSSLSTKIFEYAAMGKPVVCTRLPLVERTFPPGTVLTYEPGDPDAMAARILETVDRPGDRDTRVAATLGFVSAHSWEQDAPAYLAILDGLVRAD